MLEKDPSDRSRLAAIFRGVHTIKGTSGFIPLEKLQSVAHAGENLLSLLRDGVLPVTADVVSGLLAMVDALRAMVTEVEASGSDGENQHRDLIDRLAALASAAPPIERGLPPPTPAESAPPPPPTAKAEPPAVVAEPPKLSLAPPPPPTPPSPVDHEAASGEADKQRALTTIADSTVRVDVGLLDRVMSLVGELVLARNQIIQYGTTVKNAGFADASARLNLLTSELHESVMKTRMQPIGNVWNKFPRVTRDLALACGKRVELKMEGEDTELDRTIIEAIKDPLTHAVRNAIDHGLESPEVRREKGKPETGVLTLRAYHEGGQVNVEISDDGGGINLEKVRARALERKLISPDRAARMSERELLHLIFLPGFSTAAAVTNVSGRGVGMDVVKTNIERIGGTVDVHSNVGKGTTLKIKLPLTLAIVPALMVTANGHRFAIPQVNLLELVRLEHEQLTGIEVVNGTRVYRLRGNLLPLVFLDEALQLGPAQKQRDGANIVVLQADERQFGLVVDAVHDTEEIVVKPLGKALKGINTFSGATIMGDGRVALILDVLGIAQRVNVVSNSTRQHAVAGRAVTSSDAQPAQTMLSFEVAPSHRVAVPLAMVARLEEIAAASVEHASSVEVVQYRGEIMPLVSLPRLLGFDDPRTDETLQVIVFRRANRSIGVVVHRILDISEQVIKPSTLATHQLLSGSAVLAGKVTDLLDVQALLQQFDSEAAPLAAAA